MNPGQIACCSHVSLGFGTPQMQHLLRSLMQHYRPRKPVLVCEPHSDAVPELHQEMDYLSFYRIASGTWKTPFWYMDRGPGEAEYRDAVSRWLAVHRPELLVLTSVNQFEYLVQSGHVPECLIYYAFEIYDKIGLTPAMLNAHDRAKGWISMALFPEKHRVRYYDREFGYDGIRKLLLYNAPPRNSCQVKPASKRNGRILMQGTIQWGLTYVEYLLNAQRPNIPVDIYGLIYGQEAKLLAIPDVARAFGLRYLGYVSNAILNDVRADYSYALVMWNPSSFNTLYACPNKLFEAIASGVPPICAPHPQCVDVVKRYDCGLLMKDWSYESFCATLEEARSLLGTPRYTELVKNCLRAHRSELNWESQFKKLSAVLPRLGNGRISTARSRCQPRAFVADPSLIAGQPDHGIQTTALLRLARNNGQEPVAIVNRMLAAPLPDAATVHPVFWHDGYGRDTARPERPRESRAAARFINDLSATLAREGLQETDHIHVIFASEEYITAFAAWIANASATPRACWHLVLSSDIGVPGESLVRTLRRLRRTLKSRNLRLYSNAAALVAEYQIASGLPFQLLSVPEGSVPCPSGYEADTAPRTGASGSRRNNLAA